MSRPEGEDQRLASQARLRLSGDTLRSKTRPAQVNELLLKMLAHNLCVIVQSIFELGIEPEFWQESESTFRID
jgi:hypothetical protein